jgi:hypothetical protein
MRDIKVTITGNSPLLMHNISGMAKSQSGSVKRIPGIQEEAEAHLYWLSEAKTHLAIPAAAVHGSILKASAKFKVGKNTLWSLVASCCHIGPELISLGTTSYEIDVRSVIVQKARVWRSRGKVMPWEATFTMTFDEDWLPLPVMQETMPKIINTAGRLVGILDYRPEKRGSFGTFHWTHYELLPATVSRAPEEHKALGFEQPSKRKVA